MSHRYAQPAMRTWFGASETYETAAATEYFDAVAPVGGAKL
jgi:hypothetical protein